MPETLFERMSDAQRAHARRDDPQTSHQAADSVTPGLGAIQQRVEVWARSKPEGFLDLDLVDALADLGPSTARTRRAELVARNIILDSGRRERPEGASTPHTIWIHRNHVPGAPPIREAPDPITPKDRDDARKLAIQLAGVAKQNRAYGLLGCETVALEAAALLKRLAN